MNMKALLGLLVLFGSFNAHAKLVNKMVQYKDGDVTMEGYLSYDDKKKNAPGVLVVHEWMGLDDYVKSRADQLAKLGYVAFAADIFGAGVRPATPEAAGKEAGKYKSDLPLLRKRAQLGLDQLLAAPTVDKTRVAAIGYCFGGTTALELARAGADIKGAVSFHGGLSTKNLKDAANIKAKVLVLHGADDPNVPPKEVDTFEKEMRDAKVDWQLVSYGGSVHKFSNPSAGNDNSKGYAYNEKADKRSWQAMQDFFAEIFKK